MGKRTVPLQASSRYPTTPDGRYFVVRGILWRCSNPQLPETVRQDLVKQLAQLRRSGRGVVGLAQPVAQHVGLPCTAETLQGLDLWAWTRSIPR